MLYTQGGFTYTRYSAATVSASFGAPHSKGSSLMFHRTHRLLRSLVIRSGVISFIGAAVGASLIGTAAAPVANLAAVSGVLNVPSTAYPTISSAIAAAGYGATIVVAPGTYHEAIRVYNKQIAIIAQPVYNCYVYRTCTNYQSLAAETVIAPPTSEPALIWQYSHYSGSYQSQLSGFTIENGYSGAAGQGGDVTFADQADVQMSYSVINNGKSTTNGGGVLVYQSNPVFSYVTIENSGASLLGGGMLVVQSDPNVVNSTFSGNYAGAGGGMWIDENSNPVVVNSTFQNNTANGTTSAASGEGGAIGLRTGVSGVYEDNTFTSNTAFFGGAMELETQGGQPTILGNTFTSNSATTNGSVSGSGQGGAIGLYNNSQGQITLNTFSGNYAYQNGGAIILAQGANMSIYNNVFDGNNADATNPGSNPSGADGGAIAATDGTAHLVQNCFYQNSAQVGGGLAALGSSNLTLQSNTFIDNVERRTDVAYLPGGVYVYSGASSFSSNSDIIANNTGTQFYDTTPSGSWTNDLLYDPSGDSYLVAYGSGGSGVYGSGEYGYGNITSISQIGSPLTFSSLAQFAPQFSNAATCTSTGSTAAYGVPNAMNPAPVPVYRFFGTYYQTHFFTTDVNERDLTLAMQPVTQYGYEGIGFYAYATQVNGTVPVYRFFQTAAPNSHFYTASQTEYQDLVNNPSLGWKYEGIAFYEYQPSGGSNACPIANTGPVYRFVNLQNGSHFFTASYQEYQTVLNTLSNEWHYEAISFCVPDVAI